MFTSVSERSRSNAFAARLGLTILAAFPVLLVACHAGPPYVRPRVETPAAYKELAPPEPVGSPAWKPANPKDDAIRGRWWEGFHDPVLNSLEEKVDISNQNIAAASASFLAARALVRQAKAGYYPTVTGNPGITNSRPSPGQFGGVRVGSSSASGLSLRSFTNYSLPGEASWEPDLWGRVRLAVRRNSLAAQVSAADLENVRLAAHAELAVYYFELRGEDALKQVLDSTVAAYRESLDLVEAQYKAGLANDETVAAAETQLESAEAADTNLGILRAQYEHAIALLVGESPSTFSLAPAPLASRPPDIPVGVPSKLVERRPDVAAAERSVAEANAQIGLARTAFFPNLLLSAAGGFDNTSFADWLTWPGRFWSWGPALTQTVFDGGLRRATVQQYQALHEQAVANYRQTTLTAFQQVEDNLATLRVLSQDIQQQEAAVQSARRYFEEATARYQAGLDPYLNVITAQTLLTNAEGTAVGYRTQQFVSSVLLIEALGGGWDTSQLPSPAGPSTNPSRTSSTGRGAS
jgi:NodT family efflux transporter outer membrane factor (OMF) lipoprotein